MGLNFGSTISSVMAVGENPFRARHHYYFKRYKTGIRFNIATKLRYLGKNLTKEVVDLYSEN